MNLAESIAYIERRQDEARAFVAGQHKLAAEASVNAGRVWPFAVGGLFLGAGIFAAGMAFGKFLL